MNRRSKLLIAVLAAVSAIALTVAIGWVVVAQIDRRAPAVLASTAEDLRGVTGVEKVDGLTQTDPDTGVTTVDAYLDVHVRPATSSTTLGKLTSTLIGKVERHSTTAVRLHVTVIDGNARVALSSTGGPKVAAAHNRARLDLANALARDPDVSGVAITWNLHSNHPNIDDSNHSLLVVVTTNTTSRQSLLTTFSALAPLVSSTTVDGVLTVRRGSSVARSPLSMASKSDLSSGFRSISFSLGGAPTDPTVLSFVRAIDGQSGVLGYTVTGGGDSYYCRIAIKSTADQRSIRNLPGAKALKQLIVYGA